MNKIKNVLFRAKLKGRGIVNFDSSDQKFVYNGSDMHHMKTLHDNTSYAKKKFYRDENNNLKYKISISSDCLRHDIFKDEIPFQSPNIINGDHILYSFIASPASLIRGYLFADTSETLKRGGALTITDAIQTCNAVSTIETFTKSGKKLTDSDKTDNTFFRKETIGDVEYQTQGNIDLMTLQFVSCDKVFDRYAFNPDMFNIYKQFMSLKFPTFDSELGYYQIKSSDIDIPEHGLMLSNENVVLLVKETLKKLFGLNITRKGSFANVTELQYKLVQDPLTDTFHNDEGWVTISSVNDINTINFEVEQFYTLIDKNVATEKRRMIEEDYENRKNKDAETKAKKKSDAKKAKDKKNEDSE